MSDTARIGVVDASTEAGTREFRVVLDDHAFVQLDDLLVCRQTLPDGSILAHYGIVTEQVSVSEGATLPSDTHAMSEHGLPGQTVRMAHVSVLRTDPELWVSPAPHADVMLATGDERQRALFEDQMRAMLPVGLDQSGAPVHADFTFLNGEQGGHISISGVSGVAAKTSFALFLLHMIFETGTGRHLLGAHAPNTRALVFNVKGEDLLHLDRPARDFPDDARAQWAALGVEDPHPFTSVAMHVPPLPGGDSSQLAPDVRSRSVQEVSVYGWTPEEFIRRGLLRFCLTDQDERSNQTSFVEQAVRVQLARHAYPLIGEPGAVVILNDPHSDSKTFERVVTHRPSPQSQGMGVAIRDYGDLLDLLAEKLDPDTGDSAWQGGAQAGTLMAFQRRLMALGPRLGHLIRCGVNEITLDRHITVVDIHSLHQTAQRFVVGALVSEVFDAKQGTGREPLRFIMLDELNKYAPRDGHGPLRDLFIDIAERGRSLGVLLVGCQQDAGRVAEPVVRQPALKVCGRLDAEAAGEYRFLTPEVRERSTRFLPGTMVISQPLLPAPIPARFPRPPYATNTADAARTARDTAAEDAAFTALES